MAGDWIKMRGALLQSPKLIAMSRRLMAVPGFHEWLTPGDGGANISDSALRCVTCALLMQLWSASREFGKFDGDDLILDHLDISDIDSIVCCPGVGAAMAAVGWAIEDCQRRCVILPNFKQHNVPMTNADKQAAYRKRQAEGCTELRRVTCALPFDGNKTVTREEKRRVYTLSLSAEEVAQELADKFIGLGGGGKADRIASSFAAKIKSGICSAADLEAAIDAPGRDVSEPYWALLQRHNWDGGKARSERRRRAPTVEDIVKQIGEDDNGAPR